MDTHDDSTLLSHGPCDVCGSSDANAQYSDGHSFCFSCEAHTPSAGHAPKIIKQAPDLLPVGDFNALVKRKITEATVKKFGYSVSQFKDQTVQIANYKRNGQIIAQKVRFPSKDFLMLGNAKEAGLFGQHLFREGGKTLTITEGEIDCLTVSQVMQNKWPVVSIPQGAAGAARAVKREIDFVSSYEKVVIMMDNDEAGQKAAIDIAMLLKPNQAFIAALPAKDPSELMMSGRSSEIISAFWEAKPYRPDGIVNGADLLDEILKVDDTESVDYPWPELNIKTHGLRKGELTVFTAGSGVGKSAVVREIAFSLLDKDHKVGMIMLEESVKRTVQSMIGLELNKPIHIDRTGVTDEDIASAFKKTLGSGNLYLYDHFGSVSSDNLMDRIRYLAVACDCEFIVLDHISIAVSDPSFQDHGLDERKTIDMLMTRCRSLVEELGIGLILISHLKRPEGKGHEEGATTSLSQLRSSHSIAQLADMVIGLERNQQSIDESNQTNVRVLKNRFSGETGLATTLHFNTKSGRITEEVFYADDCEY